jgi:hypothetical protein
MANGIWVIKKAPAMMTAFYMPRQDILSETTNHWD